MDCGTEPCPAQYLCRAWNGGTEPSNQVLINSNRND